MLDPRVVLIHREAYDYPSTAHAFRPGTAYSECLFPGDVSPEENAAYDMVREAFHLLGLDAEHYGTPAWNPLGAYIRPGQRVLIKPNLVMHENGSGYGMECLITHPSVVAPVVDYVLKALQGSGRVMIGDAPIQDCHFGELLERGGYRVLQAYYQRRGVALPIVDFRNVRRQLVDGIYVDQDAAEASEHGILVRMPEGASAFDGLSEERLERMRVSNYDKRLMQKHHAVKKHEYKIARAVLAADVVISMPKPKTHRFGGITAALKNMVGINANKECLPHHTNGSKEEDGDCYVRPNDALVRANAHLDARNLLMREGKSEAARKEMQQYRASLMEGMLERGEKYWSGGWSGNDTIWRTILDLNHILYFADKDGIVRDTPQRKVLIVADLLQGGQRSGPLAPTPAQAGVIAVGENPLLFDRAVCSVMGFDYERIPQLRAHDLSIDHALLQGGAEPQIVSDDPQWDGKTLAEVRTHGLHFQPCYGWEPVLGMGDFHDLQEAIRAHGGHVHVFGCGQIGQAQARTLQRWGFTVDAFLDNDASKWGKEYQGIPCHDPKEADKRVPCVIAVKGYGIVQALRKQTQEMGMAEVWVFNDQTEA